jgi:hypothetical protein
MLYIQLTFVQARCTLTDSEIGGTCARCQRLNLAYLPRPPSLKRSAGPSEFAIDPDEATMLSPQGRRRATRSITAKRTAALAPPPPPPSPREIYISLDHGTVYTKAAVRLIWGHNTRDITLQELEPITWPNNDTSFLT